MNAPVISVLIPTYNRPELLLQAVASVFAQTTPPVEIVVVDDDAAQLVGTVLAGQSYRATCPIRVIAGPGKGPGAARNAGLAEARGDWAAFLDDDDLWRPEKLERQGQALAGHPDLVALGTALHREGQVTTRAHTKGLRYLNLRSLLKANRLAMSSVLARRDLLLACGGFDESLPLAQDWDLWLRVAATGALGVLSDPLTVYRRHRGQRSAQAEGLRRCETEVLGRALARGLPNPALETVTKRRLAWAHLRLGRLLQVRGELVAAFQEFSCAMRLFPYHPMTWLGLAQCYRLHWAPPETKS